MTRWGNGIAVAALALVACGRTPTTTIDTQPSIISVSLPAVLPRTAIPAPPALKAQIDHLIAGFPGKAGVAIRAVDDGWTIEVGGRQRLPQQSVSKLWVALTVFNQRDNGLLRIDDPVTLTMGDLTLFHQPIATLVAQNGSYTTTVGDLVFRALTQSDNTANDKLLRLVGGPNAVRATIERKQLGDIRFGPGERLLQAQTAGLDWQPSFALGNNFAIARSRLSPETRVAAMDAYTADPPDGAAPLAIADALARLSRGELLSETSTQMFLATMGATRTGRARLKAAIAPGWHLAHKTGTGQDLKRRNAGFNDVGILTAPDGRRYALAVMIGDTTETSQVRQALIQAVATAIRQTVEPSLTDKAAARALLR